MKRLIYFYLSLFSILFSCKDEAERIFEPPLCNDTYLRKDFQYELIGFYPSWKHSTLPIHSIRWDKITRIIYCFVVPGAEGDLSFGDLSQASTLSQEAHENGVEVFFSIGGGAGSNNFAGAVSSKTSREKMIRQILTFLGNNCFDGVDIDYEKYSSETPDSSLTLFMSDLSVELSKYGYKISIDLYPMHGPGKNVDDKVIELVDYAHIMAYNFSGPWLGIPGPHSSFEQAIGVGNDISSTGLAYWHEYRGWEKEKLILGVPFYGRDFDNGNGEIITYSDILSIESNAAYQDQWNNIYYDGLEVVKRKAEYIVANNFKGMMIWELAQDVVIDSLSLLTAMNKVLNQ